jgi:hypothetical protein
MHLGIMAVVLAASSIASADGVLPEQPRPVVTATLTAPPESVGWNLLYVELLGKAGPYGIGYERRITDRMSLGIAASYANVRGQKIATAAPYLHARLLGNRTALFCELGAVLARTKIPSPVPEWDGMTDAGGGGFASLGWQRSWRRVVIRAQGSVLVGEGGAAPWGGFAIGFRP